jgi:TPR repeat protein
MPVEDDPPAYEPSSSSQVQNHTKTDSKQSINLVSIDEPHNLYCRAMELKNKLFATNNNNADALALLFQAAEAGNPASHFQIGVMHSKGLGTKKCKITAFEWYMKGALLNDRDAQYKVGKFYHFGKGGVAGDMNAAIAWYRKAASQKEPKSDKFLREMYDASGF